MSQINTTNGTKKKSGISFNMTRKMSKRGFVGKKKKTCISPNFIFDKKSQKEFKKQINEIIGIADDLMNIIYSLRSVVTMCTLTLPEKTNNDFIQTKDNKKWKELIEFNKNLNLVIEKCTIVDNALREIKLQVRMDKALEIIISKVIGSLNYIQTNLPQIVIDCNNFAPKYIDDIRAIGTEEAIAVCTYIENTLPYLINGPLVKPNFSSVSSDEIKKEEELDNAFSKKETIEK